MFGRFAVFAIAMALPFCAIAAETTTPKQEVVESPIFRLDIPMGWKIVTRGPPINIRGPDNELMVIEAAVQASQTDDAKGLATSGLIEKLWKDQLGNAMNKQVTFEGMTVTEPLHETTLDGRLLLKAKALVEKEGGFISSYGLIDHGGTYFMVTVAGWLKDKEAAESTTESMLQGIVWKNKQ